MSTPAAPTPAEGAPSSSVPTPAASEPARPSSFISSALSDLSKIGKEETPPSPSPSPTAPPAKEGAAPEVTPTAPPAKEGAAPEVTPTAPPAKEGAAAPDEEDLKAEADIKRETANMPAGQRAAFTKLRYEARDLKRQLKAAEAAKAEAVTPAQTTEATEELTRLRTEYETMKSKVANYEKEAYTTRLEATELFQNEVVKPRENVASEVSAIAKRYADIDEEAVVTAVRTGDPERVSRVTADMSEYDRFNFYALVKQYHGISAKEASLRENSQEQLETLYRTQREQKEAKLADEKSQWEKSVGDVWKQLEEDFPVLAPVEGDEDWNTKIENIKKFATPDRFEKLTVRERAEALYRAAAFPVLEAELENTVNQMKEMQEKLNKYGEATPGVSSGGGASPDSGSGSGVIANPQAGFVENALANLRKIGH